VNRWDVFGLAVGLLFLPVVGFCQISYLPGWPQATYGSQTSPLAIADVNGDGMMELVYGDGSYGGQGDWWLYVKKTDGMDAQGWPINNAGSWNPLALADFDDDGTLEIVNPAGLQMRKNDGILIWQIPGNGPIFQGKYVPYNVSIDDLENDGNKEIVVTCYSGGAIFVFDAQGNVKPGWPVIIPTQPGYTAPGMLKSASIGDIDNDGLKEILVGVDEGGASTYPNHVYCLKPDGTYCPGFPVGVSRQGYNCKAVLADVDNDGYLEIIIGKLNKELNIYRHDGSLFPGYPIAYATQDISVADIYRDGRLEIFFDRNMTLGAWGFDAQTGTLLSNLPFTDPSGTFGFSPAAPILCRISSASGLDLVTGAVNGNLVGDGKLFAFNTNGQVSTGFPSSLLPHRELVTGCSVADVDGNGTTDICCGSKNLESTVPRHASVYCWDTGYPYNLDNVDWAKDGFDIANTGRWRRLYHINKGSSQLSVVGCQPGTCSLPPDGNLHDVTVSAIRQTDGQAASGQDVRFSRTLGCGEYEGPVMENGDGTYTRFLRAPLTECTTEIHAWVNEFKLNSCQTIQFVAFSGGAPPPIPDGHWTAGTPMGAARITSDGTTSHITWDVAACPAPDYNLYSGPISGVSSYAYDAWQCSLGAFGSADITLASGNVFFLIVPVSGTTEGSHGFTGAGTERPASGVGHCGITTKDASGTCP
jgi:hypothetical protein